MPNRLIKESVCTSEKVNGLTDFQFRLWALLITYVDDYGRGDARPAVIRGRCFPLRMETVTEKRITEGLKALEEAGCIVEYEANDGRYLCFPNWEKHQTIRNKKSKFPPPPATCKQLKSIESNCNQLQANAPVIQSNPNPNPNPNPVVVVDAQERDNNSSLVSYARSHLKGMSETNTDELREYADTLPEDVIRFAIDDACANDVRKWAYVRTILVEYNYLNIRTVEQARARRDAKAGQRMKDSNGHRPMDERESDETDWTPDYTELMNRPRGGAA